MTTDELITKARHAIETGQPNLAQLYMRKALEQTEQQRRELNPWYAVNQHAKAFTGAVNGLVQAYLDAVREVLPGLMRVIAETEANRMQSEYALVGPAK